VAESKQDPTPETARFIRDLLALVEAGEVDASTAEDRRILLRLEGAVATLEADT